MKHLVLGICIGLVLGLTCTACAVAKGFLSAEPLTPILTERNYVNTTKVTTEEGTYRIFMIENRNAQFGGVGITAVKIK